MEIGPIVWICFVVLVVLLIVFLWRSSFDWNTKHPQPPLIGWMLPHIGVAISLILYGPKFLIDLRKKGDIFRLYLGGLVIYYVPEIEFFSIFYKKPENEISFYGIFKHFGLVGILMDNSAAVSVEDGNNATILMKKQFLPILKAFTPWMQQAVNRFIENMGTEGKFKNLASSCSKLVVEISTLVFTGERLYNNTEFIKKLLVFEGLARSIHSTLQKEKLNAKIIKEREETTEFIREEYKYRQEHKIDRNDLLQMLITDGNGSLEQQIHRIFGFFVAILSNTQITLCWVLTFILKHPEVFNEVLKEVNKLPDAPTIEDLLKTPILEAVIKETLRNIAVPLHLRANLAEIDYKGFKIPKDSVIAVSPYAQAHSSSYPYPDAFDIRNMLNNESITTNDFLPFGMGKHKCIGRPVAMLLLKYPIIGFLKTFDWKLESPIPDKDYVNCIGVPYPSKDITVSYVKK